jgi:hypothetical protein
MVAIIVVAVIAVSLAALYVGGNAVESTGDYITNTTTGSYWLGWASPAGSYLSDVGSSWVKIAETGAFTLTGLGVVALGLFCKFR